METDIISDISTTVICGVTKFISLYKHELLMTALLVGVFFWLYLRIQEDKQRLET